MTEPSVQQRQVGAISKPPGASGLKQRLRRILEIVAAVQSGSVPDIDSLVRRLNVTRRTIFDDLSILSDVGAPCVLDPDKGRYVLAESTLQSVRYLAHAEVFSLLLMFRVALSHPGIRNREAAHAAIRKMRQLIPPDLGRDMDALLDCLTIRHARETTPNPELLEKLFFATSGRHEIDLYPVGRARKRAIRLFPYHLVYSDQQWTLRAFSQATEQTESYPLKDIKTVEVLGDRLDPQHPTM